MPMQASAGKGPRSFAGALSRPEPLYCTEVIGLATFVRLQSGTTLAVTKVLPQQQYYCWQPGWCLCCVHTCSHVLVRAIVVCG